MVAAYPSGPSLFPETNGAFSVATYYPQSTYSARQKLEKSLLMESVLLLDKHSRIIFATHIPKPLSYRDVLGKTPWDKSLVPNGEPIQAAMMRALSSGDPQAVDARTEAVGVWRAFIFPVQNIPSISFVIMARQIPDEVAALSKRESEVARLIASGATTKQIASRLGIKRSTVDNHRAAIARKLRVHTAELDLHIGRLAYLFR